MGIRKRKEIGDKKSDFKKIWRRVHVVYLCSYVNIHLHGYICSLQFEVVPHTYAKVVPYKKKLFSTEISAEKS